jgi:hypothetical protein
MRQRNTEPRRRLQRLEPRETYLVWCGGLRTERDYFDGLKKALGNPRITVEIRGTGKSPAQVVQAAAELRDRRPGMFSEVWCVVDVDEFDLTDAVAEAGKREINLAVSNPCFELWLLLHHADCRAHCAGCADVAARLKKHVRAYDKARLNFADDADSVTVAVTRARDLGGDHTTNPSTGVWRLVETITEKS